MHNLVSVIAFVFVLVAMVGLVAGFRRAFDAFLRLIGDERKASS